MTNIITWTEIEGFHNVKKSVDKYPELLSGTNKVSYRAKVKLHGTNAGIQVHPDGTVFAQSRTTILSETNDNAGFAKWVKSQEDKWKACQGYVVFGEWCGPGIQKGVAVNQIPKKSFAVFAARPIDPYDKSLIVEPIVLDKLVGSIPDVYILPWYGNEFSIDF
jgi:hypothetical protein